MIVIKDLAKMIRCELDDSEHYAKHALKYKESDNRLAELFYNLAKVELDHARQLHDQAVRLIKESSETPPEAMTAVWEWEHDHYIEEAEEVQIMLNMFKE